MESQVSGYSFSFLNRFPPFVAGRIIASTGVFSTLDSQESEKFVARAKTGSLFRGSLNDFHARTFAALGYYDWRVWAIARYLCKTGDTIIEIGANVGTETIAFSDIVGENGKVFAFEPLPSNVNQLQDALSLRQFKNVNIIPKAVGNKDGSIHFSQPKSAYMSGTGFVINDDNDASSIKSEHITVESTTLDTLLGELRGAKLIHMDVEGSESQVLQGARQFIVTYQPYIILEASHKLLKRNGSSIEALYSNLIDLDYTPFQIARTGIQKLNALSEKKSQNWLCIPNGSAHSYKRVSRFLFYCGASPFLFRLNPLAGKMPK